MIRPPASSKRTSSRLAESLFELDCIEDCFEKIPQILESIELPSDYSQRSRRSIATVEKNAPSEPYSIGIWESRIEDGKRAFVRSERLGDWRAWAEHIERIPPKGIRRRVLLLGESVARGFLLDPYFNPAIALQSLLEHAIESDDVEVVDLARNALVFSVLEDMLSKVPLLDPDAIVIMAGNNWAVPGRGMSIDLLKVVHILHNERRWEPIVHYMESIYIERTRRCLRSLQRLQRQLAIPILFIIPEFNLLNWKDDFGGKLPLLDSEATERWSELRSSAEIAFDIGNVDLAADYARNMIEIDEGMGACGFDLLGRCALRKGDFAEARRKLESARDATLSLPTVKEPRCYGVIQKTLRDEGPSYGIHIIDFPARVSEYLSGGLPGSRLFLDYCHLTVEGIHLAMASAGESLLPLLGYPTRTWQELKAYKIHVEPRVESYSHFLAAIHNALSGQDKETLSYHSLEAIRLYPDVSETMLQFLDFYVRRAPAVLCKSFESMIRNENLSAEKYLADPPQEKILNLDLVFAFAEATDKVKPEVHDHLNRVLKDEHGIRSWVNLLHYSYHHPRKGSLDYEWKKRSGYYRSYNRVCEFIVILDHVQDAQLVLTYRVPFNAQAPEKVMLRVNGKLTAELPLEKRWKRVEVHISANYLAEGINKISIEWPRSVWSRDSRLKAVIDELTFMDFEQGLALPQMFVAYGDLHSIKISTGSNG